MSNHRKPKKATAARLPSVNNAPPIQPAAGGELRALPLFESLSPEHMTFLIEDSASAPHLKKDEYAVVDLSDREPQRGELYVIQYGRGCRTVIEAKRSRVAPEHWWVGSLRRTFEWEGAYYCFVDGPYRTEHLKSVLIGRVVGFALSPLGDLLAPAAEVAPPPAARQAQVSAAGGDMPDCLQRWIDSEVVREEPRERSR